ncbi:MAG: carboxylating nicotinate-nucleotide diphosphorylase [Deltaproteobacteria bacterium]|nr:carboxylating nicotinate-nucleotide diphosphorylase [Deltaproteobacteria bacterium]
MPGLIEYSGLLIRAALKEDIGAGDVTTLAVVPKGARGEAYLIAKEDLVIAGLFMAEKVFKCLDKNSSFKPFFKDGDLVRKGEKIATVAGRLNSLLTGERVALNFLQRLSGIATLTSMFVKKAGKVKILDTRKTTPCLRLPEKYAVKAGGGHNHRFGLFDSILIKDNHIKAAGGVREAVRRVYKKYGDSIPVEVEAKSLKDVKEAMTSGADIIMLDNMDIAKMKKALKMIKKKALIEVSGGITLDNISKAASIGVDFISIGALTHSARAVDISMEVRIYAGKKSGRA